MQGKRARGQRLPGSSNRQAGAGEVLAGCDASYPATPGVTGPRVQPVHRPRAPSCTWQVGGLLQPAGTSPPQALPAARAAGASFCRQPQQVCTGAGAAAVQRGCRAPAVQHLLRSRRAASALPGAAGLGIPGLAGSAGTHRHQGPPSRHLCAGAVPVTGTPGAGPYRTSHLALQPFIALPWLAARRHGALPSLRARWLIVIPWRWTPTGVACQG